MAREVVKDRCEVCGREDSEPKHRWTCDLCGKPEIVAYQDFHPEYPEGWLLLASPEALKRGVAGNDFCSWKCAADYAHQQEIAVEAARG